MTDDRARVLARVRAALARSPARTPMPEYADDMAVPRGAPAPARARAPDVEGDAAGARDPHDLARVFMDRLAAIGGRAFSDPGDLGRWLAAGGHRRGYCDPAVWPDLAPAFPSGLRVETRFDRARVDDYAFGITQAAGAIAETGTIVLDDRSTSRRLAALAPWVHVAVVRCATVHALLVDAVRALGGGAGPGVIGARGARGDDDRPGDPYVVWCTGPSRTADVEGILIEGVHGPGEQVALVLPEKLA